MLIDRFFCRERLGARQKEIRTRYILYAVASFHSEAI